MNYLCFFVEKSGIFCTQPWSQYMFSGRKSDPTQPKKLNFLSEKNAEELNCREGFDLDDDDISGTHSLVFG